MEDKNGGQPVTLEFLMSLMKDQLERSNAIEERMELEWKRTSENIRMVASVCDSMLASIREQRESLRELRESSQAQQLSIDDLKISTANLRDVARIQESRMQKLEGRA